MPRLMRQCYAGPLKRSITKEKGSCMTNSQVDPSLNVFGEPLLPCSSDPLTGVFRDGCCNTSDQDTGSHTICVQISEDFLRYTQSRGNDLGTPVPEADFPGLQPGDKWCVCAPRWLEAYENKMAPRVFLARTHQRALEIVSLEVLRQYEAA